MNSIKSYYDDFLVRLIANYANGNPRVTEAIRFAAQNIPGKTRHILDIGFGIGWSTQELVFNNPQAHVTGIDLSERLTKFAKSLFPHERAEFLEKDLTNWIPELSENYDAVVMIDVYEHVPISERKTFHDNLRKILKRDATVILTCPSVSHQRHLRENDPDGLQPVDEDVTKSCAEQMARDLSLSLINFKPVSIWSEGDYNHILLGKQSRRQKRIVRLQSTKKRRERLQSSCGLRVHPEGIVSGTEFDHSICVATPSLGKYSETFIRHHIENLPFNVRTLSGWQLTQADDRQLSRNSVAEKGFEILASKAKGKSRTQLLHERQADWLSAQNTKVVVAEYGRTAVEILPACKLAKIPLIVHFHGYDAYCPEVTGAAGSSYQQVFEYCASIVGVSKAMCDQLILSLGAPVEKVEYIPSYVDLSSFKTESNKNASNSLLAVGRLVEKKAPHLTILAFSKTLKHFPSITLDIVGDGPLLGPCKWLCHSLGIMDSVRFHGSLDHSHVSRMMKTARAFIQHSVQAYSGDCEGTPVAILEAQASGLPVVSTKHTGIIDVVEDGKTGFLTEEGDVDKMSENIKRIFEMSTQELDTMGLLARKRVETCFSNEKTLGKLATIIDKAINQNG